MIGVFGMYWPCSRPKRETIHSSSISKTGHPVILKFEIEQSGFEWHPNHRVVLEAEMVYVGGDSPKLCSKIIQVVDYIDPT